jgi:hypothetical protein
MKRVHFIGNGYESIRFITVDNNITNGEAFEIAKQWYGQTNQSFEYIGMEISL